MNRTLLVLLGGMLIVQLVSAQGAALGAGPNPVNALMGAGKGAGNPGGALGGAAGGRMGAMARMLNPMGPGRPFVRGMTKGQVSDLMGGRPGPVPMDIAQRAAAMSLMGHTADQIADVLGDVLQARRAMSGRFAAAAAMAGGRGMGAMGPRGMRTQG